MCKPICSVWQWDGGSGCFGLKGGACSGASDSFFSQTNQHLRWQRLQRCNCFCFSVDAYRNIQILRSWWVLLFWYNHCVWHRSDSQQWPSGFSSSNVAFVATSSHLITFYLFPAPRTISGHYCITVGGLALHCFCLSCCTQTEAVCEREK